MTRGAGGGGGRVLAILPHTNHVCVPPMWARRYVIQTLGTTCVWNHPKALCTATHMSVNPPWLDLSTCCEPTVVDYVYSDVQQSLDVYSAQWVWCLTEGSASDSLSCVASASFSGTTWYLHATCQALEKVTLLQKLRIYTHFTNQHKGRCSLWSPSEYQQLLCNSCSQAIQHADNESNLGRWAELLEFRIPHLPFNRNPLLPRGGGATPRVLGRQLPPPPPRGLRPTVSCQRYEPKEPTGAEGTQRGYVAILPTCGPFSDSAPRSEAVGIP